MDVTCLAPVSVSNHPPADLNLSRGSKMTEVVVEDLHAITTPTVEGVVVVAAAAELEGADPSILEISATSVDRVAIMHTIVVRVEAAEAVEEAGPGHAHHAESPEGEATAGVGQGPRNVAVEADQDLRDYLSVQASYSTETGSN